MTKPPRDSAQIAATIASRIRKRLPALGGALLVILIAGTEPGLRAEGAVGTAPGGGATTGKTKGAPPPITKRTLLTLRGEIVDYYCFIEKGARGPSHRECGVRCVAGDVCMGLYTTDDRLFMISINHLRAMSPIAYKGIPDPFAKCRGLIAETVDLTGYAMERKGQRIIEVTDVKKVALP